SAVSALLISVLALHPDLPRSTLFPYTTLFRSGRAGIGEVVPLLESCLASDEPLLVLAALDGLNALGAVLPFSIVSRFFGTPLLKDRKSTRLNSSHVKISYAVFCLKKKNTKRTT